MVCPSLPEGVVLEADEELQHTEAGVCVCFNGVADLETPGTLAVTTRNVRWLHPTGDATKHLRLAFRQISMHAVSRDTGSFPRECIYMQVDGVEGVALPQREGDEEEDEEEQVTEVHIVPAAPSTLDHLFQVLCDCAALNPDMDGDDEDGEGGGFFYDEEEVLAGAGGDERAAILDRFDAMLQIPSSDGVEDLIANDPERFEDNE